MSYFLTIAASDTSGGAGVYQDLKVAQYYGFWGLSALTAITSQDFNNVYSVTPLEKEVFEKQLQCLLKSFKPDCIKIGLVPNIEILDIIYHYLQKIETYVVLDPVFQSSSGFDFIDDSYIALLKKSLSDCVSVITPNSNELAMLIGEKNLDYKRAIEAAKMIVKQYNCDLYVKGGHFSGNLIQEAYISKNDCHGFEYARRHWAYSHGTGCAFSSALAINRVLHTDIKKVLQESHYYVNEFYEALNKV
ncbi:MAG TPA: hydroxymethylpyrimidine/phosphomethylpyrimidine kinase [Candidatus Cloacimonadota bacterium]|nr:hydroxymethylpyrimidine/phosphomethylpyrimidine kinase [Candidatus Cloacimonadota bacterium]HOQ80862.1 hydroxymethylpyrimidine/phosphomethylpyrimidine kinase [Candidatus Cloacimonadota bacterium]